MRKLKIAVVENYDFTSKTMPVLFAIEHYGSYPIPDKSKKPIYSISPKGGIIMYICKARELYGEELDDGSESFRYLIGELKTDSDGKYVINGILINAETIIPIKLQLNDEQKKY